MNRRGKLFFFCGKMAAGKSTLARKIACREDAILLVQDDLLNALFPDEIVDIASFIQYSTRLQNALSEPICSLLAKNLSVVLDFPGNTRKQRAWFRQICERANVEHELHYVDVTDELCKHQLRQRSQTLPAGSPFTSDAEFEAITQYFQEPSDDENFNVIRHQRD